jgi:hypothetical protein
LTWLLYGLLKLLGFTLFGFFTVSSSKEPLKNVRFVCSSLTTPPIQHMCPNYRIFILLILSSSDFERSIWDPKYWSLLQKEEDRQMIMMGCRSIETTAMEIFARHGWRFSNRIAF